MAVIDDDLEVMRHEAPQSGPGYGLWAGGEGVVPVAAVALRQLERAQAVDGDGAVYVPVESSVTPCALPSTLMAKECVS